MPFNCGDDAVEADDNLGGGAFPRNCNAWTCDVCRPKRRKRLIAEVLSGRPNRFITITCRENQFASPDIGARELAYAWKRVVQRWRRLKPGNKCQYFCVMEAQVNGWPHIHIAWRGPWIDQPWLKAQMAELINSPHVDVRLIRDQQKVAWYVAKYVGKSPHKFTTSKRYWCSRDYRGDWRKEHKSIFRFDRKQWRISRTMQQVEADWRRQNRNIQYLQSGGIAWGRWWNEIKPPKRKRGRSLRYIGGFPKYVSKGRITPLERADDA